MKRMIIVLIILFLGTGILWAQTATAPTVGDGSSGNPYEIGTLNNLYWIAENSARWGYYYEQTADIVATATTGWTGGWLPIGNASPNFSGSYNGQGYTVSNLYINRDTDDNGLFFRLGGSGVVQNIGLININFTFTTTGGNYTGGLIGRNYGTVNNCYSTGSINSGGFCGGLIGHNFGTGIVNNCYSTVSVTGTTGPGGFMASNSGTVTNCYSIGAISGTVSPRGFIGVNGGTVNDCFWDTQTSNQSSSAAGTGKTTTEMKNLATFTDQATSGLTTAWDFETNPNDDVANNDYWDMDYSQTINNGYPYLSWQDGGAVSLPVELTSFSAQCEGNSIVLEWITESEVDNLGYILERKIDNSDWQQIASYQTHETLKGQGNTSSRTEYRFTDENVQSGGTYTYCLSDVDFQGSVTIDDFITITVTLDNLNELTELLPAFPNPFNPTTKIQYTLGEDNDVTLSVVDMVGRTVQTIISGQKQTAGSHSVHWNGNNESGQTAASGVYFLVLNAGNVNKTQKVMLLR